MDTDRIDVFNKADGDLLTFGIADDFQFQLFPAEDALLDKHLIDKTCRKSAGNDFAQFFNVVNDTAAGSAHRVGRAQNNGITQLRGDLFSFFDRVAGFGFRHRDTQTVHRVFEFDTVFTAFDRFKIDTDDFDIVFFQNTGIVE